MPQTLRDTITKKIRQLFTSCYLPNEILVKFQDNSVTLSGTVDSFYQKQLCFSAVTSVPGGHRVVDELQVDWQ